eukprot:8600849-Pyramimonas_sp.AAC.1
MRAPRANVISANDAARGNPGSTRVVAFSEAARSCYMKMRIARTQLGATPEAPEWAHSAKLRAQRGCAIIKGDGAHPATGRQRRRL